MDTRISEPGTGTPPAPVFPRSPGETPRAFAAFTAFFRLGPGRTLQAVADQLGENFGTVRNWSAKFGWIDRINAHAAGLLQQQVDAQSAVTRDQLADWARRNAELREQQWTASRKLLDAAQCFLDSFGDEELQRMNLSQVSRALQIGSRLAHHSLSASPLPDEPSALAPVQAELMTALRKMYGPDTDISDPASPSAPEPSGGMSDTSPASPTSPESPTSPSPTSPDSVIQSPITPHGSPSPPATCHPPLTTALRPRIVGGSMSVIGSRHRIPTP